MSRVGFFSIIFFELTSVFSQMDSTDVHLNLEGNLVENYMTISLPFNDGPDLMALDSLWVADLMNNDISDTMYQWVQNVDLGTSYQDTTYLRRLNDQIESLVRRTPLKVPLNQNIQQLVWNLNHHKSDLVQRVIDKSSYYFPLFEEKLAKYDLPLELKYLAIVESALNPTAISRAGAAGLWQFMYSTGKVYDLNVTSYVDERFDPVYATEAACKYLKRLHEIYEDWDLALAAYNSGPGNVNKAIRRSGGSKDFWKIRDFLPRETAGYVPSFYAFLILLDNFEDYGYSSGKHTFNWLETDTVHVKSMINFEQLQRFLKEDQETIMALNPSFKLKIIPEKKDGYYAVRLPINTIGTFVANEEEIYALANAERAQNQETLPSLVSMEEKVVYKVKSGDYLGKIAARYGVTVGQLMRWNGLRSNQLKIGQRITIHSKINQNPKETNLTAATQVKLPQEESKIYVVKQGDSLWTIAQRYPGVTIESLKKWNGLQSSKLKPGTKLMICDCSS